MTLPPTAVMAPPISTIVEFLSEIIKIPRSEDRFLVFRGHRNYTWAVLPSILRGSAQLLEAEKDISREIISLYPSEFDLETSTFDRLTKMQHFGIATRLLDVTTNPLVALFIATEQMNEDDENGLVLSFDGPNNRKKYFDSDAVSCKANLSNLTSNEKDTIANSSARTIVEFNQLKPVRRLVQFIKSEKPCFLSEIVRTDLHKPYLVIPKMRNRRIIAQHGAFIIFGLDRELGPTYSRDIKARRIVVAKEAKADIRHERFKLGIHAGILFPEIDRSANQIMRRFLS